LARLIRFKPSRKKRFNIHRSFTHQTPLSLIPLLHEILCDINAIKKYQYPNHARQQYKETERAYPEKTVDLPNVATRINATGTTLAQ
jgi:hypothetical protein